MRKTRWLATLVVAGLALVLSGTAQAQEPDFDLLVFTGRGGTPPPVAGNGELQNFALYLFAALIMWGFFSSVINASMVAMVGSLVDQVT